MTTTTTPATTTPATEIRPEVNPSNGRVEFAVYIDGAHCGYAGSNLAGATLRDEILAARAAADASQPRCYGSQNAPCGPCQRLGRPCTEATRIATGTQPAAEAVTDAGRGYVKLCQAEAEANPVAAGFEAMAQMIRAGAAGPVGVTEEQAELEAPKRRRKASSCTCPQCQPAAAADGIYRCKAGNEWVAYHDGLYVASGLFLAVSDMLNDHRHTLLSKPLPDATPEEVADVLAATKLAA